MNNSKTFAKQTQYVSIAMPMGMCMCMAMMNAMKLRGSMFIS